MNALLKMLAGLILGVVLLPAAGLAEELAEAPDRVGRIAYLAGDVQFYSEDAQAWLPAQLNAPVTSRNSLYTGPDSRAEIRFGSTAVALDGATQLDIHVLDDNGFKAAVVQGSVGIRVRYLENGEMYELITPSGRYALLQGGRYRVDAAAGSSSVTVLAGRVRAALSDGSAVPVEAGSALSATASGFALSAARSTVLDAWLAQGDDLYRAGQSARYVSPNMTGHEELDANGRWANDPDYGNVWYPTTYVSPDWAPYRDGRWAYVAPWGWTWIDAAPWGFAPFHYGRWVLIGSAWAWTPGAYVARPSYAPALVGFLGGSTAVSITVGARPAVGWYPLPPWEHYRPAYRHHASHSRNINNFHIDHPPSNAWRMVDRNRVSANQAQGATVVSREVFVDSRPVRRATLAVPVPVLVSPPVGAVPLAAPQRFGSGRSEFGDRRGGREPDTGATTRRWGKPDEATRSTQPGFDAEAVQRSDVRPGLPRGENRATERQSLPAVIVPPAASQPAPPQRVDSPPQRRIAQPQEFLDTPPVRREGWQRGSAPSAGAAAVPPARIVTVPAPPHPQVQQPTALPLPERAGDASVRREGWQRGNAGMEAPPQARPSAPPPEMAAPRVRIETPALRPEPRMEPRAEPRPMPRTEQRIELHPEPRQLQRIEPPHQARTPPPQFQPQPEQRRAPEQERERRSHGERGRE